jgi:hypothetical protein
MREQIPEALALDLLACSNGTAHFQQDQHSVELISLQWMEFHFLFLLVFLSTVFHQQLADSYVSFDYSQSCLSNEF